MDDFTLRVAAIIMFISVCFIIMFSLIFIKINNNNDFKKCGLINNSIQVEIIGEMVKKDGVTWEPMGELREVDCL